MKKNLQITFALLIFTIVFGAWSNCFGQMAGDYRPALVTDKTVIDAAKFAVRAEAKKMRKTFRFAGVKQAETQVVAGRNYRLCMEYTVTEKGKKVTKNATAVIFLNLKQKFSLTSWEEAVCIQIVQNKTYE
jgi:stress response protein SCP2